MGGPRHGSHPRRATSTCLLAVLAVAAGVACREDAPAAQPPVTVTIETTTIPTAPPAASQPESTTTTIAGVAYIVAPGDTLSGIAARFGVSVAAILAANTIADPSLIAVGQTLIVPGAQAPPPTEAPTTEAPAPGEGTTGEVPAGGPEEPAGDGADAVVPTTVAAAE